MPLIEQSLTSLAEVRLQLKLYTLTAVTSSETLTADTADTTFSFAHTDLAPNYFGTFYEGVVSPNSTVSTSVMTIDYSAGTVTFSATRTGDITCASYSYFAWDYSKDKILERLINKASTDFSKACNRNFIKDTYTEYHKGSGRQRLVVNQYPINKITSVKVDSAALTAGTDYVTSDQTYHDQGIIFKESGWAFYGYLTGLVGELTAPVDNIEVVYSAGYTLEPETSRNLPYDIEEVVVSMVSDLYGQQQNGTVGLKRYTEGKITYEFTATPLIEQHSSVIARYAKKVC
jgi:hypothetical protein